MENSTGLKGVKVTWLKSPVVSLAICCSAICDIVLPLNCNMSAFLLMYLVFFLIKGLILTLLSLFQTIIQALKIISIQLLQPYEIIAPSNKFSS